MTTDDATTLTIDETAEFLKVERSSVKKMIRAGTIPYARLSERVIRIPKWLLVQRLNEMAGGDL